SSAPAQRPDATRAGRAYDVRRSLLSLLIAALAAAALWTAAPAHADTVADEGHFVDLINQSRAAAGARPLQVLSSLVSIARDHSVEMANTNSIWHTQNLADKFPPEWISLGENVGRGSNTTVDGLHQAFMNSTSHRDNILNGNFNYVGIGVLMSGSTMYVTEEFMQGPDGLTAQSASTAAPQNESPAVQGPGTIARKDWYFAEGYTGAGFSEELNILNPLGVPANVSITYLLAGGASKVQNISAPG